MVMQAVYYIYFLSGVEVKDNKVVLAPCPQQSPSNCFEETEEGKWCSELCWLVCLLNDLSESF